MTWKKLREMDGVEFNVQKIKKDSKDRVYFVTDKDEAFYPPLWLFEDAAEKEGQLTDYFIEQWNPLFKLSFHLNQDDKRIWDLEYRLK